MALLSQDLIADFRPTNAFAPQKLASSPMTPNPELPFSRVMVELLVALSGLQLQPTASPALSHLSESSSPLQ